jgi:V/A-type H+-transporting ATPase subunit E
MTGLEKIVRDISKESETAISAVLEGAHRDAEQIRKESETEANEQCKAIRLRAEQEAEEVRDRMTSAANLQKRRTILKAKQQIISEIFEKARLKLSELPENEYFGLILKVAAKYALPEKGEILFSPKDLKRLPPDFEKKLNSALKDGAFLTVSSHSQSINGGFILVYGGVEENCSFSALFDAKRDEIQDKVQALLFAEA